MLSILIPVYNYDIRPLAKMVYQQASESGIAFELLIADDASSQLDLRKKNQLYNHLAYCRFHQFPKNRGRTYTRNYLANQAQFDYLLFLDADVLPKNPDFIKAYIQEINQADVVFGGIAYQEKPPTTKAILRWKYGSEREAKALGQRQANPYYTIISQSFLIEKELFLKANSSLENVYGLDSVFTKNLKNLNVSVKHIDNPTYHLGLETSVVFITKTIQGLKNLVDFEKSGQVSMDYRPVQKAYLKLKATGTSKLFQKSIARMENRILKNLMGPQPSLFLFDLYKLAQYAAFKEA